MAEPKFDVAPPEAVAVATTRSIELTGVATRSEHDLIGNADVPWNAYWGIHTLRAVDNFPITGVSVGHFQEFVRALVLVKQAAARANRRLGHLPAAKADVIDRACDLIAKDGRYHDQFVVDAIQGGAGTSTNMNTNEVIANVALELMGRPKGDYTALHPNDDVNMAQSTNDAYPTALRLAIIFAAAPLIAALDELAFAFKSKAVEFGDVLKIGRTQLQDAVPMTLGQEFDAFFATIKEDIARLKEAAALFREVNLGATAIGTGINADPRYAALAIEELSRASHEPMVPASNLIVTRCAEGGQLQLNAFEPTIGYCVLSSLRTLTAAVNTLVRKCVVGIEADRERCRALVEDSIGLVTALVPALGYETCSRVAKQALAQKRKVADIVLEENLLTQEQMSRLLRPDAMTAPARSI